jgi:hypothetical protein
MCHAAEPAAFEVPRVRQAGGKWAMRINPVWRRKTRRALTNEATGLPPICLRPKMRKLSIRHPSTSFRLKSPSLPPGNSRFDILSHRLGFRYSRWSGWRDSNPRPLRPERRSGHFARFCLIPTNSAKSTQVAETQLLKWVNDSDRFRQGPSHFFPLWLPWWLPPWLPRRV